MLEGIGDLGIITTQLEVNQLIELNLLNFTYESAAEIAKTQKYVKGKLRDQSSTQSTITDTLTFRINDIDWGQQQFASNKLSKAITSFNMPTLKYGEVPETAAFEHGDTKITVPNLPDIFVYFNADAPGSPPMSLTPTADATTAPASMSEVQIDTANQKFIFHSSAAGRPFSYTVPRIITTAEAVGGPGEGTKIGKFKFFGQEYSTKPREGYDLMFPEVSLDGRANVDYSSVPPVLEITATPATPSGWDEPFVRINNATVVEA